MDSRTTYNPSSSFSIDNILRDKREEPQAGYPFEFQHQEATQCLRPTVQATYPPFPYGTLGPWSHYQPYGYTPFDRSRKTTGK